MKLSKFAIAFAGICFLTLSSCSSHKSQTAMTPIQLSLPKPTPKDHLIVLDPGHGGYDLGTNSKQCNEKNIALATAILTKKHLSDMGYKVLLTRSRDVFIPLKQRAEIANKTKSHLFVSLHFNSAPSPDAAGIEVYYFESRNKWRATSSKKVAKDVLSNLLSATGAASRGVKSGNFHVIRETNMPAILVEGGFLTNKDEKKLLTNQKYLDKIARGVAEGVNKYFGE